MINEKTIRNLIEEEIKPYKEYLEKILKQSQHDKYLNIIEKLKTSEQRLLRELIEANKRFEGKLSNLSDLYLYEAEILSAIDNFHVECKRYIYLNNVYKYYIEQQLSKLH